MSDLLRFRAKLCLCANAWLIYEGRVLLIHHKKLGVWLSPGGHVDEFEAPHQAAEREFWEETGIKVKTFESEGFPVSVEGEFLPHPFISNLHWVCKENYWLRQGIGKAEDVPEGWRKRGCEQHMTFGYMVYPVRGVEFRQNVEETLGISWFTEAELDQLNTYDSVKAEARFVFKHYPG